MASTLHAQVQRTRSAWSSQRRQGCTSRAALQGTSQLHFSKQRRLFVSCSAEAPKPPVVQGISPFGSTATSVTPRLSTPGVTPSAPYSTKTWSWRGNSIKYAVAGCGQPIILIHGFGASAAQFRKNIPVLSKDHKVYALDLLGFGDSDKPAMQYSMELWRDQIKDFMQEFCPDQPVVLVGNSIGSLACLMVNASSEPGRVRGTVLLNTAGAMNNKGVVSDWRIILAYPIFLLIDILLNIPPVARFLFDSFRSKDNIRQVLSNVYMNQESVDDELVDMIHGPGTSPEALPVFVSVITGPPGPKPWDLMPQLQGPLLVLWGDKDPFTPMDGPVGRFMQALPATRPSTTFAVLPDVGHCPHDDRPDLVHAELLPWLEALDLQDCPAATTST